MNKCNFCGDLVTNGELPACVAACTKDAITFGKRVELVQEGWERVAALRQANPNAVLYGDKEMGGLHVMYVLDDSPETYGLPADPEIPAAATLRGVFQWVGIGAAVAVIAGFGLNYIVAREAKMTSELPGKEQMKWRRRE